jgi:hypothetical protein
MSLKKRMLLEKTTQTRMSQMRMSFMAMRKQEISATLTEVSWIWAISDTETVSFCRSWTLDLTGNSNEKVHIASTINCISKNDRLSNLINK